MTVHPVPDTYEMVRVLSIFLLLAPSLLARERPGYWFLTFWPSARSTAMGTWLTATGDDPYLCHTNPAGLAQSTSNLAITYSPWLPEIIPGIYYYSLGGVSRLSEERGAGVWWCYFDLGKTELIDSTGRRIGEYRHYQSALSLGYGERLAQNLMLGAAIKLISSRVYHIWRLDWWNPYLDEGERRGWAVDAGLRYEFTPSISLGSLFQNLGPDLSNGTGQSIPLPKLFRLGVSFEPLNTEKVKLLITTELTKILVGLFYDPKDTLSFYEELESEFKDAWKGLGLELWLYKLIALRAGYFEDLTNWRGGFARSPEGELIRLPFTLGAGLQHKRLQLDLATDHLIYHYPTTSWKFTLGYRF